MSPVVKQINRFEPITPEYDEKINELLRLMKEHFDPLPKLYRIIQEKSDMDEQKLPTTANPKRLYCYVFLRSRQWNLQDAFDMMKCVVKYREENHLDDGVPLPSCFAVRGWDEEAALRFFNADPRPVGPIDRLCKNIDPYLSGAWHYWDRRGLPVLYLMIGNVDEGGLLRSARQMANIGESASDVVWKYVQFAVAVGEHLTQYQQDRCDRGELKDEGVDASEGLLRSATIVVDLTGLNFKMLWKPALDLFQTIMKNIFRFYPDCVYRIFVVNCPAMVMIAYNLVKGAINEQVQNKIYFAKPQDTFNVLQQVIREEYIPAFLGGKCKCANNCIGSYDPENPKKKVSSDADDDSFVQTENVVIGAGKHFEKTVDVAAGVDVSWEFGVESGKEINFTVCFVPESKKSAAFSPTSHKLKDFDDFIVHKDTVGGDSGHYAAPTKGTLVLMWDNKDSWLLSKSVQLKVFTLEAGEQSPVNDKPLNSRDKTSEK